MDTWYSTSVYSKVTLAIGLLFMIKRWARGKMNTIKKDLKGKIIIVTGSNTGIGFETAKELAFMNATIIFACRNKQNTIQAIENIKQATHNDNLHYIRLDLSDQETVRDFVQEFTQKFQRLDILINNAGLFLSNYSVTKQGLESTIGVNYVGMYLLTQLLLPLLKQSKEAKIVNVSSMAYQFAGSPKLEDILEEKNFNSKVYSISKLLVNTYTKSMSMQLQQENTKNLKIVAMHPGFGRTEVFRDVLKNKVTMVITGILWPLIYLISKSQNEAAQTVIFLCVEDFDKLQNGCYYVDCKVKKYTKQVEDQEFQKDLLKHSEQWIKY